MSKYYPPTIDTQQFHCIYCGVYAKQEWNSLYFGYSGQSVSPIKYSRCAHCAAKSYWHEKRMIIPSDSPVEPPHPDMPSEISGEYAEARSIFGRSPRASAALLRLAVQKFMPVLGQAGGNINNDIKALVAAGLPIQVQQALDYCRVIGNNAVHPGEISLTDTPDMAQHLFSMINFIVEDRITRPKHIATLYAQLPDPAREAIAKRDSTDGA